MVYLPPALLCQLLYGDGLPTSSTPLPAAVYRWSTYLQYSSASCCIEMVYLPPVFLCQLLYTVDIVYIPPVLLCQLLYRYSIVYLPPVLLCQLLSSMVYLPPVLLCQLLYSIVYLPPVLLCQLLYGYSLCCRRFLVHLVLEIVSTHDFQVDLQQISFSLG